MIIVGITDVLLILLKERFVIIFDNACRVLDLFSAFLIAATDFVATDFVHWSEKKYWGGFRQTQRSLAYQKNFWRLSGRKWNQPSEWRPAGRRPYIEWCYRLLRFHSSEMGLGDGKSVNDVAHDLFSIKLVWFSIESRNIFDDQCLNSIYVRWFCDKATEIHASSKSLSIIYESFCFLDREYVHVSFAKQSSWSGF